MDHVFENLTPSQLEADSHVYREVFDRVGALHFKGLLQDDRRLLTYLDDLTTLTRKLLAHAGVEVDAQESVAQLLAALHKKESGLPRYLYDIGTAPMKLLSGTMLKHHPVVLALCSALLGESAIVASPSQSDMFILHFPGDLAADGDLPIHQDFTYQMQSPRQIIFWIPLCRNTSSDLGTVRFWAGSHKMGVRRTRVLDAFNGYAVVEGADEVAGFQSLTFDWDLYDVFLLDGLALHQSVRNASADEVRLIQTFRYTDLNHPLADRIHWRSTGYVDHSTEYRRSIRFEDGFPELAETE